MKLRFFKGNAMATNQQSVLGDMNVIVPVSSEISDLCEISDLLLFYSYFASQNKEITSGNSFFMCVV